MFLCDELSDPLWFNIFYILPRSRTKDYTKTSKDFKTTPLDILQTYSIAEFHQEYIMRFIGK